MTKIAGLLLKLFKLLLARFYPIHQNLMLAYTNPCTNLSLCH